MNVLAAHNVTAAPEVALATISRVLGLSTYDARLKLNVASPGPVILATHEDVETLEIYAEVLCESGVPAFTLTTEQLPKPFVPRRIAFDEGGLVLQSRDGEQVRVRYDDVRMLIRGIGITSFETTEIQTTRKLAVGRAIVSGGLLLTKKVETSQTQTRDTRAGFCFVDCMDGLQPALLNETELQYDGLGDSMKATRALNFAYICERLQGACAGAHYDAQLLHRARQVQILGPKLAPESYLDWAVASLIRSLKPGI